MFLLPLTTILQVFASSALLHLIFFSNSVVFVDRGRKIIPCPRAQGTLATPMTGRPNRNRHCLQLHSVNYPSKNFGRYNYFYRTHTIWQSPKQHFWRNVKKFKLIISDLCFDSLFGYQN